MILIVKYLNLVISPVTSVTVDSETDFGVFLHTAVAGRACYCQNIKFKTNLLNIHYRYYIILHRFQSVNFRVIRLLFQFPDAVLV